MRRLLPFISGVLFLAALVGLIVTISLPGKIKQTSPLLNYDHRGRFQYLLYLKPSSLSGTPLPPTSTYPAAVVSKIDFIFRYSKVEKTAVDISINAVLENPGIWKKTLPLLPKTGKPGDFVVDFSLDVPKVAGIFSDIETEIKMPSAAARRVTIDIGVTGAGTGFKQSLPLNLTESVIEVSNDLKHRDITGTGILDYKVALTNGMLFDTATLGPPAFAVAAPLILEPGQIALARLADSMDVVLQYDFKADKPVSNVAINADITAIVEAPNRWSKTFSILSTAKNASSLLVNFPLNVADYVQFIDTVNREAGVSAESYSLTIQANIHTVAESQFGRIDEVFRPSLKGTVKGDVLEWGKELSKTQPGAIKETRTVPNPGKSSNLPITIVLTVLFLAFFVFSVFSYRRYQPVPLSPYQVEVRQIDKKYGQRIALSTGKTPVPGDNVVYLESIGDLLKIADELGKPLVQQKSDDIQVYYLLDGVTRYQYSVPAAPDKAGE